MKYKVCAVLRKVLVHAKKGQSGFCLGKDQLTCCCVAASNTMCECQRLNVLYVESDGTCLESSKADLQVASV